MIKIILQFEDNLSVLAGNDFGVEVYNEQLKGVFDISKNNILIFPENISLICSSFIQGMFSDLLDLYSPDEIYNKLQLSSDEIRKWVYRGLYE